MSVVLDVNNKKLSMEVDTRAVVSVISEATKACMFPNVTLNNTSACVPHYIAIQENKWLLLEKYQSQLHMDRKVIC